MIYVFLAPGFEEVEAIASVDVLRRAEYQVKTVGIGGKKVTGSHGVEITADIADSEVTTDDMELVLLPGGMPGTLNLEKSPIVQASLDYCVREGKYIAAICAAPSILGRRGDLKGKEAICFPGFESQLHGAKIAESAVCVDGKIITGKGPGVTLAFALKIVEMLSGKPLSEKIRMGMQCQ